MSRGKNILLRSNYSTTQVSRLRIKSKGGKQSWMRGIEPLTSRNIYGLNYDVQSEEISWSSPNYSIVYNSHLVSAKESDWLFFHCVSFPFPSSEKYVLFIGDSTVAILGKEQQHEMTFMQSTDIERITQREKSTFEKFPRYLSNILWNRFNWKRQQQRSTQGEQNEESFTHEHLIQKISSNTVSPEEKRLAVIESEVVAFPPGSAETLNRLLFQFIKQHRDSEDQLDIVAVGSAIRKYVATMDRADLSALAILLDAEHNATVPIEVELEVAKTLVRKLVELPPDEPNSEPRLADRLYEIAKLYLNPRLLSRDKFAAVALNAILSLCLLRSAYADEVRQALKVLPVSWFSELVLRRASQIQKTLHEKLSPEQAAHCTEQLAALNIDTILREG